MIAGPTPPQTPEPVILVQPAAAPVPPPAPAPDLIALVLTVLAGLKGGTMTPSALLASVLGVALTALLGWQAAHTLNPSGPAGATTPTAPVTVHVAPATTGTTPVVATETRTPTPVVASTTGVPAAPVLGSLAVAAICEANGTPPAWLSSPSLALSLESIGSRLDVYTANSAGSPDFTAAVARFGVPVLVVRDRNQAVVWQGVLPASEAALVAKVKAIREGTDK